MALWPPCLVDSACEYPHGPTAPGYPPPPSCLMYVLSGLTGGYADCCCGCHGPYPDTECAEPGGGERGAPPPPCWCCSVGAMLGIGGYISAAGIDEAGVLRSYALVGVAICDIGEKGYGNVLVSQESWNLPKYPRKSLFFLLFFLRCHGQRLRVTFPPT